MKKLIGHLPLSFSFLTLLQFSRLFIRIKLDFLIIFLHQIKYEK